MKRKLFNNYVTAICTLFKITKVQLFTAKKKPQYVGARYMLFHLCKDAGMRPAEIQLYMKEAGYSIAHSNVLYGQRVSQEKTQIDEYYKTELNKLKE